jgi:hypothetical protein
MRRGQEVFITQITDRGLVMQYCQRDIHLYMENELHIQCKSLAFVLSLGAWAHVTNVLRRFRTGSVVFQANFLIVYAVLSTYC